MAGHWCPSVSSLRLVCLRTFSASFDYMFVPSKVIWRRGVPPLRCIASGQESLHTDVLHILHEADEGTCSASSQAMSQSAKYWGKLHRPCLVVDRDPTGAARRPLICICTTLEGCEPSELPSLRGTARSRGFCRSYILRRTTSDPGALIEQPIRTTVMSRNVTNSRNS